MNLFRRDYSRGVFWVALLAFFGGATSSPATTTPYTNDFQSGSAPEFLSWFSGPGAGTSIASVVERSSGHFVYSEEVTKTEGGATSQVSVLSGVQVTDLGPAVSNSSFTYRADMTLDVQPPGSITFGLRFLGDDTSATNALGTAYIADVAQNGAVRLFRFVNNAANTSMATTVNNGTVGGLTFGHTYTMEVEGAYDAMGALSMTLRVFDGLGFDKVATTNAPQTEPLTGQYFGFRTSLGSNVTANLTLAVDYDNVSITSASAPPLVPGDFDGDGDVDGADFVAWQTNFPTAEGATLAQGDADGDGDVDGADFVVWQTNFPFTPSPGTISIPEPGSVLLIGIGVLLCATCGRRAPRLRADVRKI